MFSVRRAVNELNILSIAPGHNSCMTDHFAVSVCTLEKYDIAFPCAVERDRPPEIPHVPRSAGNNYVVMGENEVHKTGTIKPFRCNTGIFIWRTNKAISVVNDAILPGFIQDPVKRYEGIIGDQAFAYKRNVIIRVGKSQSEQGQHYDNQVFQNYLLMLNDSVLN